ncbi:hypothetical protein ACP70R_036976 [Stipagrostis hirtigluma subsp. patula]
MALQLRHWLPLPLLLVVLVAAASHGAPSGGDSYDASLCAPDRCGNVSVGYPFYFPNKAAVLLGNSSSYCGYPGFAVLCEDGKAAMEFGGEKYYVSNIDYNDFTVSLVDPEVQEDGSCPIADHNVTLPQTSWMYYPNTTVDYLVFFLNCSFGSGIGRPTNISPIGCDIFGGGLSFVLPRRDVPAGDWWRACQQVVEVPVLKYVLPADPQNDPDWRNRGFGRALRAGFQLAWERKNSACDQCEQSKGQCGYNQEGEFVGCLCSDRRVQAHNCTSA